jgi:hypothetical protein
MTGEGAGGRAARSPAKRNMAARMAALSPPEPPAAEPEPEPSPRPRRRTRAATGARGQAAGQMPREQVRPGAFYDARLSITTTYAQVQALRAARLTDGIQATARLRAMISLWEDDPAYRERVNRLAERWQ